MEKLFQIIITCKSDQDDAGSSEIVLRSCSSVIISTEFEPNHLPWSIEFDNLS